MSNAIAYGSGTGKAGGLRWGRIGAIFLIVFGLLTIFSSATVITSGYVGVVSDWGSVQKYALAPGMHILMPFYQSVDQVSVQPRTMSSTESAATRDLQMVTTSVAVTFNVMPAYAPSFYKNFRDFQSLNSQIIHPVVSNDVKAITAHYNSDELVTKRDAVDAQIKAAVVQSFAPYHLNVQEVNIANFRFSPEYQQAVEAKQVSQQKALQARFNLEQAKIDAQQRVVRAAAQAQATVAQAKGQAQATILRARATAKANDLINLSLTKHILALRAINRWSGVMPQYLTGNAPLPFIGGSAVALKN